MKDITLDGITIKVSEEDFNKLKEQFVTESSGQWKPELNGKYWYIDSGGNAYYLSCANDTGDNWRFEQGNCFKTLEEAKDHKRYLEAAARIRNSSTWVPDWSNEDQAKYFVRYDHDADELINDYWCGVQYAFVVYYESREAADQAIKECGDDYLLVMGIKK